MKKLLINAFLGTACLLSCVDARGMDTAMEAIRDANIEQLKSAIAQNNIDLKQVEVFKIFVDNAVQANASDVLRHLIKNDQIGYFTQKGERFFDLINLALRSSDVEILQLICNGNADTVIPELANQFGWMKFIISALSSDNPEIVEFILDKTSLFDDNGNFFEDSEGYNLLYYALKEKNVKALQVLLWINLHTYEYHHGGIKSSLYDRRGRPTNGLVSILCSRVSSEGPKISQLLMKQPDVLLSSPCSKIDYSASKCPNSVFINACQVGSAEAIEWLIDTFSIDADAVFKQKYLSGKSYETTALIQAVNYKNINAVKALLRRGAEVNAKAGGRTALIMATMTNDTEMVKTLLDVPGIDVNQSGINKSTEVSNVGPLIAFEPMSAYVDMIGDSPLHIASRNRDCAVFKLLLTHKDIDINIPNAYGNTPLMFAVYNGNLEAVRYLLERPEIDLNAKNELGYTALHFLSHAKNEAIASLLLNNGRTPQQ